MLLKSLCAQVERSALTPEFFHHYFSHCAGRECSQAFPLLLVWYKYHALQLSLAKGSTLFMKRYMLYKLVARDVKPHHMASGLSFATINEDIVSNF